eukprot:2385554-Pyramimonas_sp.AAC.1
MVRSTKQKAMEAQVRHEHREEREERVRQKKELVKAANKDAASTRSRVPRSITTPISHPDPHQLQQAYVDYAAFLKAKGERPQFWTVRLRSSRTASQSHGLRMRSPWAWPDPESDRALEMQAIRPCVVWRTTLR